MEQPLRRIDLIRNLLVASLVEADEAMAKAATKTVGDIAAERTNDSRWLAEARREFLWLSAAFDEINTAMASGEPEVAVQRRVSRFNGTRKAFFDAVHTLMREAEVRARKQAALEKAKERKPSELKTRLKERRTDGR